MANYLVKRNDPDPWVITEHNFNGFFNVLLL